jgi:hypothetical protein
MKPSTNTSVVQSQNNNVVTTTTANAISRSSVNLNAVVAEINI